MLRLLTQKGFYVQFAVNVTTQELQYCCGIQGHVNCKMKNGVQTSRDTLGTGKMCRGTHQTRQKDSQLQNNQIGEAVCEDRQKVGCIGGLAMYAELLQRTAMQAGPHQRLEHWPECRAGGQQGPCRVLAKMAVCFLNRVLQRGCRQGFWRRVDKDGQLSLISVTYLYREVYRQILVGVGQQVGSG